MVGKKIPVSVNLDSFEDLATKRIQDLEFEVEYYKRDVLRANEATMDAEDDVKAARVKQQKAQKDLVLLKSSIAHQNLEGTIAKVEGLCQGIPSGYTLMKLGSKLGPAPPASPSISAEKEAELNGKIAALQEDKRRSAEKLGAKIQSLNNDNGKLQEDLKHCQEQLNRYQQLLAPIVKLAELAKTCQQLQLDEIRDEVIAEADLICFSIPSDPALGSKADERGGGSVLSEELNLSALSTGSAVTSTTSFGLGLSAAGETAGLGDANNVITAEEMEELEMLLTEDFH